MACVTAGFMWGRFSADTGFAGALPDLHNQRVSQTFRYTNQLLACGDLNSIGYGTMHDLRDTVRTIIDSSVSASKITKASVYLRDLDNGPWMGLGERDDFYPASLLKLPLLIALYKQEQDAPGFLDKEVAYTKAAFPNVTVLFPPEKTLEIGKKYTIRELARRAVVYSDNEAASLAGSQLSFSTLTSVFSDLGIDTPDQGQDYQTSVRTYGSFFRILYNASYINRELSEEALRVLTESSFSNGIPVGVPSGIAVAHKFGEREGNIENGDVQLHDCGVIYSPGRPYLLCVMAQAKKPGDILDLMHKISHEVYQVMSQP